MYLNKYECRAILLSLISGFVGLFASFSYQQGHWFARSGAAITIIAIIFASLELRQKLSDVMPFIEKELIRHRGEFEKAADHEKIDKGKFIKEVESSIKYDVEKVVKEKYRRILLIEVSLFVIGTIIWGFADLPLDAIFKHCS